MSHFNKIILASIIGFIYVLYIPCLGFIQTSNPLSPDTAVVTRRFDTVRSLYFIEVYILLRRHLCRELYIYYVQETCRYLVQTHLIFVSIFFRICIEIRGIHFEIQRSAYPGMSNFFSSSLK